MSMTTYRMQTLLARYVSQWTVPLKDAHTVQYEQNMNLQIYYCLAICCKQSFMYSDKKAPLAPPPPHVASH
jgi:hypothetical protein